MIEATGVLSQWESFYVIIGSSAGALTGLQFVVIALIAETQRVANLASIDAFGTPTIVHFCVVLLTSAMLSSPWPSLRGPDISLGIIAIWGLAYTSLVLRRTLRVVEYKPVMEDWIWHVMLPYIAYALILIAAFILYMNATIALFSVGAMSLLLLFVGIHNAWDTVTFLVANNTKADKPNFPAAAPGSEAPPPAAESASVPPTADPAPRSSD